MTVSTDFRSIARASNEGYDPATSRTPVMRAKAALVFAALCALRQPAIAAPSYETIDVPGATTTYISVINDAGVVGGSYFVGGGDGHSFIRAADGTITTFDPPGANGSAVRGMDAAGDTVGLFSAGNNVPQCFIRSAAGVFTVFGHRTGRRNACYVMSINGAGYVAGQGNHGPRGAVETNAFIRTPTGRLTTFLNNVYDGIEVPSDGLNNAGTLVGSTLSGSQILGFIRAFNGTVTTFAAPGTGNTQTAGINDKGVIVGSISSQGFIRATDGTFSLFSVSRATQIQPWGINAKGDVTGFYYFGDRMSGGFVRSAKGELKTFTVDGGYTEAFGINASGVVAGAYMDAQKVTHGFIRIP